MARIFIFLLLFLTTISHLHAQSCDCESSNYQQDTASLISFFKAMGGTSWTNNSNWGNVNILASNWYGVLVDTNDETCIVCLDLDGELQPPGEFSDCGACLVMDNAPPGNSLSPTAAWPTDFVMPCLKKLALDNNQLDIELPDFNGFGALCELYLRDNLLRGELSVQRFNNPNLRILNINDNELTGGIPEELKTNGVLPNLKQLLLNNNDLTGPIPILEDMDTYAVGRNRLTFEDILPAVEALGDVFIYDHQQPVFRVMDTTISLGLPYSVALDFDLNIPDNVYQWHRNGFPIPDQTTNTLRFDSVTTQHAGVWTVSVRNPRAPGDTLESFPITISVCQPGVWDTIAEVCPDQFAIINGIAFLQDSLYHLPVSATDGCDSVWRVDLKLRSPLSTILDTFVCQGGELEYENNQYPPGIYNILTENSFCEFQDTIKFNVLEATEETIGTATISDSISCGLSFQPRGNLPPGTFGRWILQDEAFTPDLTDPDAVITDLSPGRNTISWILGAGSCPEFSSTTRTVFQEQIITITPDTLPTLFDDQSHSLEAPPYDVLQNDDVWQDLMDSFDLLIAVPPNKGSAWIDENNKLIYRRSLGPGRDTLTYGIARGQCPTEEGLVFVNIEPRFLGASDLPPNVITPDGDGYNDVLKIPLIEYNPNAFPQSNLKVYWNNEFLFEINDYQNNWGGRLPDGNLLPAGNHYRYVIDYGDDRYDKHAINLKIIYR